MFKKLLKYVMPRASKSQSTPINETNEGKLYAIVGLKNECPDCHSHGFYEGPSGGMSTNIFCVNRDCRSGFNITHFSNRSGICERIQQGDITRYPTTAA